MHKIIVPVFALALCVGTAFAEVRTGTPAQTKPNTPTMGHRPIATWRTAQSSNEQALFAAIEIGNVAKVKELLNKGVNPNVTDKDGNTPLTLAIVKGQYADIVPTLRQAGAKLNPESPMAQLIFATAPKVEGEKGLDVMRFGLSEGINPITAIDNKGQTALNNAAFYNNQSAVELLLKNGVDINTRSGMMERTPLTWTFKPEMVKYLITNGADVNLRNGNGQIPLFVADKPEVVQMLLEAGANPHKKINGKTTREFIQKQNDSEKFGYKKEGKAKMKEVIKLLKEAEKNIPNISVTQDELSLIQAAKNGDVQTIQNLLNKGVDLFAQDDNGNDVIKVAIANNQMGVINMLLDNGLIHPQRILNIAVTNKNIALLKQMQNRGASLDAQYGYTYWPPLLNAAIKCDLDKMKFLLDAGANVNVRLHTGINEGALYFANRFNCKKDVISFLEGKGLTLSEEEKKTLEGKKSTFWKDLGEVLQETFLDGIKQVGLGVAQYALTKDGSIPATTMAQALNGISTTSSGNGTCGDSKHQFTGATCDKCVNNKPRTNAACAACCATLGKPIADNRYWPNGRAPKDGFTRPGCYCVFTDGSANIF
ncbi:MAG: ankyrin repeat domain-containing protein [Elusimicrobiaceae bacterium]|nr:ankyrin repeat domain-containing protein [Elusimicrobiaceae bacterium]